MSASARRTRTPVRSSIAVAACALIALAGCGSNGNAGGDASDAPTTAASQEAAAPIEVTDPWAKAAPEGNSAMVGHLKYAGSDDLSIVSATSDVSNEVQLHETLQDESGAMVMSEVKGGFPIKAGETLELKPGGNHIMFIGLTTPLEAGEDVTVTLTFDDGETMDITAPIKDFTGADENYSHEEMGKSGGAGGHGDMSHAPSMSNAPTESGAATPAEEASN